MARHHNHDLRCGLHPSTPASQHPSFQVLGAKYVSNPDSVIKKFNAHFIHDSFSGAGFNWFVGDMERIECVDAVEQCQHHDFLVAMADGTDITAGRLHQPFIIRTPDVFSRLNTTLIVSRFRVFLLFMRGGGCVVPTVSCAPSHK